MQTLLYGAQIITQNEQDEIHKEGWILLEDDRIIGIGAGAPPEVPEGTVKRYLPGRVIMPGIVNIHTHVAQTPQEIAHDREAYGMTPVEYLFETGLAQQKLIAAHCVCVTENDVRLLAKNKVHVAHCPEVFFKAGYFAPVDLWHKYGVTYALGTDWVTLNPWTNMRIYLGCWRTLGGLDEQQAGAKLAFRKITMDAARLVGKEKEIGSLEVGKKADLIVMDAREPHLQPMYDLDIRSTLVWNATGNEVETVIIDGKTIVDGKRVLTVDETAATQEATAICHKYLARQLGAQNQL